jgi:K+-transporting ATPase A subunit
LPVTHPELDQAWPLYALLTPKVVLLLTAVAIATPAGRAGLVTNTGPHGFYRNTLRLRVVHG